MHSTETDEFALLYFTYSTGIDFGFMFSPISLNLTTLFFVSEMVSMKERLQRWIEFFYSVN